MNIMDKIRKEQCKQDVTDFSTGDTVKVHVRIVEGTNERIQVFAGTVIAAASILAKVFRDELMVELAGQYPQYGFEHHKGYGTEKHLAALKTYGVCAVHRRSFAPVRDIIDPPPEQLNLFK